VAGKASVILGGVLMVESRVLYGPSGALESRDIYTYFILFG
jgi:hypothetical protein